LTNSTGAGWTVPYVPGSIEAIAYNNKNITIANRTIITTGDPTSVGLSLDTDATIRADGQDVALVAVAILDAKVFISFPLIATY
jgi:beta-galactosidase